MRSHPSRKFDRSKDPKNEGWMIVILALCPAIFCHQIYLLFRCSWSQFQPVRALSHRGRTVDLTIDRDNRGPETPGFVFPAGTGSRCLAVGFKPSVSSDLRLQAYHYRNLRLFGMGSRGGENVSSGRPDCPFVCASTDPPVLCLLGE